MAMPSPPQTGALLSSMTKFTIIRTEAPLPNDAALAGARALLFEALDGMGDESRKCWRKFWRRMVRMEAGELVDVSMTFMRNPLFHRKYFALLNLGFESWEPCRTHKTYKGEPVRKSFDRFREDVQILAGHYEQTFHLDGAMTLSAKSISFASMDDAEFERIYSAVADVLLEKVLTKYANRADLDRVVEQLLRFV